MNCRFFKYLLIFFVVFATKAKADVKNRAFFSVCKHFNESKPHATEELEQLTSFYFLGANQPSQVFRSQVQQRSLLFFKSVFGQGGKFNVDFHVLNNSYGRANAGYVRLCKLMLFPFHVFW